jgi:hypothetical protein
MYEKILENAKKIVTRVKRVNSKFKNPGAGHIDNKIGGWLTTLGPVEDLFDGMMNELAPGEVRYKHRVSWRKAIKEQLPPAEGAAWGDLLNEALRHGERLLLAMSEIQEAAKEEKPADQVMDLVKQTAVKFMALYEMLQSQYDRHRQWSKRSDF